MKKVFFTALLCISAVFFTSGEELLSYLDALDRTSENDVKITRIERWAFAYNSLKTVKIPEGITLIGEGAFANNELTELSLPESTQIIEDWAFANNNISSVVFPPEITYIGGNAFIGNNISDITIGNYVYISRETIDGAFYDYYMENEKKAGHYILEDGIWKKI